jgi:serine/threonine-protein kinase
VKVADFGVARATEIVEAQGGAGDVTREGLVVGTARYVAPEQVAAGSLDGRTDLYAVGCVLHELLAGRPPFSRDTDLANALAHLTEAPPSLSSLGIAVSPALERLVLACLAKDPAARPASALLLAQQLRALPTGPPTAAVPVVEAAGATLVAAGAPLGAGMLPGPPAATAAWAAGARPGRALPAVPPPPAALRPPAAPRTAPPPPDRRTGTPARRHGTRTVRRPSRSRAPLVVVGGLVMAALVTALLVVSRPPPPAASGASPAASTATNRPVVADVSSFDPEADGQENDPQLPRLTDGNPATTWSSDRYNLRPAFGNLKKGVGVVVALDRPSALDRLRVRSPSRGWAAQVYVARSPASTLAGWGQPVARATGVQGDLDVALTGRSGGAVLVWFTDPGRTGQVVVGELELT